MEYFSMAFFQRAALLSELSEIVAWIYLGAAFIKVVVVVVVVHTTPEEFEKASNVLRPHYAGKINERNNHWLLRIFV